MWRCETCGKLNSTGADRCHGCDDRAPAPEEDSQDSPKDLEGSISAWSGSGALSDDVLDDPEKLKEVLKTLPAEMRPPVLGPGLLKIETTTLVEGASIVLVVLSIIFLVFVYGSCSNVRGHTVFFGFIHSWPQYLAFAAVGIVFLIASVILFIKYDVYYIIDLKRKIILLHRKVFKQTIDRPIGDFRQVEFVAAGATTIHNISKGSSPRYKCHYSVFILLEGGLKLDLPHSTINYMGAVEAARLIARLLDTRCIEGEPRKFVRFRKQSSYGSVVAEYLDPSVYKPSKLKDPFYWGCALVMFFILAYVFYLIWHQIM